MPQDNRASSSDASMQPVHFTEMALRSAGQLYDLNMSAARVLLRTQARAAAAFGLPDMSPLFDGHDERVRNVFSSGAEQVLDTARHANEALSEMQRQMGRVIETQASQAAQSWQQGLHQLGSQANESLNQLCETARRTAEDAQRGAQAMGEQMRENMRRAGDDMRSQQQQAGSAAREASSQATSDAMRADVGQQGPQGADKQAAERRPRQAA